MNWASLLSGALGGVLILLLSSLIGRLEERSRRKKELVGLLRALYFEEIVPNTAIAQRLDEDPSSIRREIVPALGQEIWAASRFRIAELAEAELFGSLVKYYAYRKTLDLYIDINEDQQKREEYGKPMAAKMRTRGKDLAESIEPLIGTTSRKSEA